MTEPVNTLDKFAAAKERMENLREYIEKYKAQQEEFLIRLVVYNDMPGYAKKQMEIFLHLQPVRLELMYHIRNTPPYVTWNEVKQTFEQHSISRDNVKQIKESVYV